MPNFDKDTIERFREERIAQTRLPKILDDWQLRTALETCEWDLREEEARLQFALALVKDSRVNIRRLKKKHNLILGRINEKG